MHKLSFLTIFITAIIFIAGCTYQNQESRPQETQGLKKFTSEKELLSFLKENQETGYNIFTIGAPSVMRTQSSGSAIDSATAQKSFDYDYSTTNIQVEGVDEPDIVKTDGRYIYISQADKLIIVDAYPAETSRILSITNLSGNAQEIFIHGDRLVIFGSAFNNEKDFRIQESGVAIMPRYPYYSGRVFIKVFDISDKNAPMIKRDVKIDGDYYDARMINGYVYAIINHNIYNDMPLALPSITENGITKKAFDYTDIYYFPMPDYSYRYTDILTFNIKDDEQEIKRNPYMLGYTQNLYVSQNNIYVTGQKQVRYIDVLERIVKEAVIPNVPLEIRGRIENALNLDISKEAKITEVFFIINEYYNKLEYEERKSIEEKISEKSSLIYEETERERQKTIIHKISINDGVVEYKSSSEVPGSPLNQFSMDENNGYFRIATTSGVLWLSEEQMPTMNHLYVLDSELKIIGKIENIAPGESIYSARFIGDRAYLVTFKKIDPLFVIDLSDTKNPRILGKLKIPGYSDYLHPYDENTIIGIGKETTESKEDFALYQGVKLALFDVSDVENPKELAKYIIGDRGTDSEALRDHKAFLFDKKKNLLVIPITLAEFKNKPTNEWEYGEYTFQGAYVFELTKEKGFVLRGRITHVTDDSAMKSGYYWYSPYSIKRSMYIDNILYTLSDKMLKSNELSTFNEIKSIELPFLEDYPVLYK